MLGSIVVADGLCMCNANINGKTKKSVYIACIFVEAYLTKKSIYTESSLVDLIEIPQLGSIAKGKKSKLVPPTMTEFHVTP